MLKYIFGAEVYGGGSPSPHRAKPAGSPLPPLGRAVSRLALCARVLLGGVSIFLIGLPVVSDRG